MAGKPQGAAWRRVCEQAKGSSADHARQFFETRLKPYAILAADGKADGLVTGYYEPLLRGSRLPRLLRRDRSARTIVDRVSWGKITRSM